MPKINEAAVSAAHKAITEWIAANQQA